MVKIEIDGKPIEVTQGSMIIEVTDELGITIPRFCYHKKLSIAANCRMCLVEVENAPKPLPACATPVTDGMKIHTKSIKTKSAQKGVMEFLLINHPLDCPICDQGGQCELQDVALEYGKSYSRYTEGKRSVADKNLGPLISTDMTRCIHCTRCVRFGQEIAGQREMGATGRGEHTEIGTFIESNVNSEISGNVIDLCPVGALTSKPFRYKARAWELMAGASISAHDCIGSNVYYHTHRGKIIRAVPRENNAVNEVWISDRDRFSYQALYQDRLTTPQQKIDGEWQDVAWEDALPKLKDQIEATLSQEPQSIGAFVSPNSTTEESYLIQKILRNLGCHNVDHRLRQTDFRHQDFQSAPYLGNTIESIENAENILLIGSDIRFEAPLIAIRIRKASQQGASISAINPVLCEYNLDHVNQLVSAKGDLAGLLFSVINAFCALHPEAKAQLPDNAKAILSEATDEQVEVLAKSLSIGASKHIILGAYAWSHPDAARIYYLAHLLGKLTGASVGEVSNGANSTGCWLAGAVPHRTAFGETRAEGRNCQEMLDDPLKAYLLFNVEPEFDFANAPHTLKALSQADLVVAFSAYDHPSLRAYADIILPITPHTEMQGSFVNIQGDWQSFAPVVSPLGDSKPLWKVLRVLGTLLGMIDMQFDHIHEIQNQLKQRFSHIKWQSNMLDMAPPQPQFQLSPDALLRLAPTPIYAVDSMTRRAKALQDTELSKTDYLHVNQVTAAKLSLHVGDTVTVSEAGHSSASVKVKVNPCVPDDTVLLANNTVASRTIGAGYSQVEIHKEEG